jgi:hypothetical protein
VIPRLHLFELEDLKWFPSRVRDFGTDYIHFLETRFELHKSIVPLLGDALRRTGSTKVVDLCSGGSGPVANIAKDLAQEGLDVQFTLTDRFPNIAAFERIVRESDGRVDYSRESVNALSVPPDLVAFRTIFNAFHHFRPDTARAILSDAVDAGQPIAIFEISERAVHTILPMFLTPLFLWLATPFIRPFSWLRLLFTYLIPIVPLYCLWDGVVSQLRAYRDSDLRKMAEGLGDGDGDGDGDYEWRAGWAPVPSIRGKVTWLIGLPRKMLVDDPAPDATAPEPAVL